MSKPGVPGASPATLICAAVHGSALHHIAEAEIKGQWRLPEWRAGQRVLLQRGGGGSARLSAA